MPHRTPKSDTPVVQLTLQLYIVQIEMRNMRARAYGVRKPAAIIARKKAFVFFPRRTVLFRF
jgi:hypothetical protein